MNLDILLKKNYTSTLFSRTKSGNRAKVYKNKIERLFEVNR